MYAHSYDSARTAFDARAKKRILCRQKQVGRRSQRARAIMACACEESGQPLCGWCVEAIEQGVAPARHHCLNGYCT